MPDGYEALRDGVAWFDLSGRGVIRVTGADRARLLHAMCTNHVQQLQPGQGCYAFFLNPQGRVLCDANILCAGGHFLLDTETETAEKLCAHLDKYIIADDVTVENDTGAMFVVALEGPDARRTLLALGAQPPDTEASWTEWNGAVVARISATGGPGYRIFAPAQDREQLLSLLEARGVVAADDDAVRTVRLERGRPRYGEDITEAHIAQETDQSRALHFNKGCYVGQEIVERVRSRGHLNRILTPLRIDGALAPASGTRIMAGEKDAGEVTSAAFSPGLSCVVALGYVRTEHLRPGAQLNVAGAAAMALASEALTK